MRRMTIMRTTLTAVLALALAGCGTRTEAADSTSVAAATRAPAPAGDEWRPLIDPTLSAWRGYKQAGVPAEWRVEGNAIVKTKPTTDLVTKETFGDFELAFDWKLDPGGNAGVFYRGTEDNDHIYWSAPEYQLLDDAGHADGRSRLTAAGALYGMYPAPAGVVKRAGEWNASRIVVRGPHVEHWLNGQKLLETELGGPEWEGKVKAGKFSSWPQYGRMPRGHIGIQGDHQGLLTLRDVRVRGL